MHSEEVMLSLRLGKKVSRARLVVVSEGWEFSLVLDAANLGMRSVKLPDIPAFDAIEHLIEKTELLSTLEDIILNLFVRYAHSNRSRRMVARGLSHWKLDSQWTTSRRGL